MDSLMGKRLLHHRCSVTVFTWQQMGSCIEQDYSATEPAKRLGEFTADWATTNDRQSPRLFCKGKDGFIGKESSFNETWNGRMGSSCSCDNDRSFEAQRLAIHLNRVWTSKATFTKEDVDTQLFGEAVS